MMDKHGSEEQYNKNVINAFKHGDDPEIIIVVDKLLTGFDAPRNTVLYLTRTAQGPHAAPGHRPGEPAVRGQGLRLHHRLLRRASRTSDKAFDLYGKLADFDQADLEGTRSPTWPRRSASFRSGTPTCGTCSRGSGTSRTRKQYERHLGRAGSCASSSTSGFRLMPGPWPLRCPRCGSWKRPPKRKSRSTRPT